MKLFNSIVLSLSLIIVVAVSGCAMPIVPTVSCLPADNKPFEMFQQDEIFCRKYAFDMMGGEDAVNSAQNQAAGLGAFVAGVNILAGALAGQSTGVGGNGYRGAQYGAAQGAINGTNAGLTLSAMSHAQLQAAYDDNYAKCMYSKGNQVQR